MLARRQVSFWTQRIREYSSFKICVLIHSICATIQEVHFRILKFNVVKIEHAHSCSSWINFEGWRASFRTNLNNVAAFRCSWECIIPSRQRNSWIINWSKFRHHLIAVLSWCCSGASAIPRVLVESGQLEVNPKHLRVYNSVNWVIVGLVSDRATRRCLVSFDTATACIEWSRWCASHTR